MIKHHSEIYYSRITSFLRDMSKNKQEIIDTIEYNQVHWIGCCKTAWKNLYDQCPPLKNISDIDIGRLFLMQGYEKFVRENFNGNLCH